MASSALPWSVPKDHAAAVEDVVHGTDLDDAVAQERHPPEVLGGQQAQAVVDRQRMEQPGRRRCAQNSRVAHLATPARTGTRSASGRVGGASAGLRRRSPMCVTGTSASGRPGRSSPGPIRTSLYQFGVVDHDVRPPARRRAVPQRAQAVAAGDDPDQPALRDHGQPVHPGVQHGLGGPADRLCGACSVHGAAHDGLDGAVAPEQQVGLEDRQRPGDVGVAQEHVAIAEHADHPALDHDRQMADAVEPHHPAGIEHGRPRRHRHGVWGHPLFDAHLSFLCVLAIDRRRPDVLSTSSGAPRSPAGPDGPPPRCRMVPPHRVRRGRACRPGGSRQPGTGRGRHDLGGHGP